ncbi:cellular tumor antigen p53 [Athalia rosae]|uniref:cellular tumor antigen p53 n=1 Tax=Athalia rosae TaxID=37344 RepID=UPI002033C686|nr:cellular tumor antigen p53 [Athalia rosae]
MSNEHTFGVLSSSQESNLMSEGTYSSLVSELLNNPVGLVDSFADCEEKCDITRHEQELLQAQSLPHHILPAEMPTSDEFAGLYNFQLDPVQNGDQKTYVYSQKLKKVFTEMDKTLPIYIKWFPAIPGLFVRAVMSFCSATHRSEPVTRCHNHIAVSNQNVPHLRHVLSCKHTNATYHEVNGHFSVLVPLGTPQTGSDYIQMDFVCHCKNSCSPGINRRPTEVIFTLENSIGEVLGRRKLQIRICSCPKRDREKEERPLKELAHSRKRKLAIGKKFMPNKKLCDDPNVFTFNVKIYGRDNYSKLRECAFDAMAGSIARGEPRHIIEPLMEEIVRMPM